MFLTACAGGATAVTAGRGAGGAGGGAPASGPSPDCIPDDDDVDDDPPTGPTPVPQEFGQLFCQPGAPLFWWGYDADGKVVAGAALGDVSEAEYQIFTCAP